ncbi:hypothetical protein [Planctopirus ephydatiae]|nr:hypothetical protein [Planctopirus ephydatiae]
MKLILTPGQIGDPLVSEKLLEGLCAIHVWQTRTPTVTRSAGV